MEQDYCDKCGQRFPTNAFGLVLALRPKGARMLCSECYTSEIESESLMQVAYDEGFPEV